MEQYRGFIRQFFVRLRLYRDRSLEDVAKAGHGLSVEKLELFETGEIPASRDIEDAYLLSCHGAVEFEHFYYELRAFKDPSAKAACRDLAKDVLKKMGIKLPYVDYQNLDAGDGAIIQFPK